MLQRYASLRLRNWLSTAAYYADSDADYFLDAQDFDQDWNKARVSQMKVRGDTATLRVVLGSPKRANTISFQTLRLKMVREAGIWKIDCVNN